MESEGFHLRRPRVRLSVHDRDRLPDHASSATFPFFLTTRWRASIQQQMRSGLNYLDGNHVGFQGEVHVHKTQGSRMSSSRLGETYDRTMANRYAEGTPQPDLDPEAWVDATGGLRKGRVYDFGDSLDITPVLSSYVSSVTPPAYASSSAASPGYGVEEMRTLIREELQMHFGVMVEQLISAMQGVRPSQPTPK
ncbi:hypothetical protein Taro_056431, partial [Colocasia esculenta]|nr:hypothetical protein [Colocasia esculenta]